jgi:hypothetical protein
MKGIKKIVMILMVLSMVLAFAGPASAKWWTVNVVHTNLADDGTCEIKVERNGKFQTFALPVGYENQFLAMALTAQAAGLQLKIEADWAAAGSDITGMIVLSNSP